MAPAHRLSGTAGVNVSALNSALGSLEPLYVREVLHELRVHLARGVRISEHFLCALRCFPFGIWCFFYLLLVVPLLCWNFGWFGGSRIWGSSRALRNIGFLPPCFWFLGHGLVLDVQRMLWRNWAFAFGGGVFFRLVSLRSSFPTSFFHALLEALWNLLLDFGYSLIHRPWTLVDHEVGHSE